MNNRNIKKQFFTVLLVFIWPFVFECTAYSNTVHVSSGEENVQLSKKIEKLYSVANTLEKSLELVAEYVEPSVVSVTTVKVFKHPTGDFHGNRKKRGKDPFREFFGEDFLERFAPRKPKREYKSQSLGSGVIVDKRGYILTNNHVIEDTDELKITLGDKREFKAEIIGTDPQTDLAVVKIEGENLIPASMGDSDKMKPGQWAIAIGNPFGFTHTVSLGVISATKRSGVGIAQYENFLQTDAAINPGNSGGPLVNIKGEVIGINTVIATRSGGYQGIGFAIPINMAKSVLRDLIDKGKVTRGWLGVVIQDLDPALAKQFNVDITEGVLVSDVQKDSPAQEAGFERGDIIIWYDNDKTTDLNQLRNVVAQTKVGQKVDVKVLRGSREKVLSVTIGEQPADLFAGGQSSAAGNDLGITVQDLTEKLADSLGYEDENGVLVSSIEADSPASQADIKEGDLIKEVNREKVGNVEAFNSALHKAGKEDDILLLMRRGAFTQFVIVKNKQQ
ncbi:MAG: DegQ family serine endoprotease [Planctomycetes bacterium]|nr:DegQ family serine endoprotease [Planctomycetota bacterium]